MSPSAEKQPSSPSDPPLRKSFLSGDFTGWTLDIPPHLRNYSLGLLLFYIFLIPVVHNLTRPNGYFTLFLDKVYGPRNTGSIIKLVTYAAFNTYIFTAIGSIYGQSMHPKGYQNTTPRLVKNELRGLAHRLTAAHQSLLEVFPGFGTVAVLVFVTLRIPTTNDGGSSLAHSTTLIDGLFLHVFLKHILYYWVYLFDDDFSRSGTHGLSISTLISVLLELSKAL